MSQHTLKPGDYFYFEKPGIHYEEGYGVCLNDDKAFLITKHHYCTWSNPRVDVIPNSATLLVETIWDTPENPMLHVEVEAALRAGYVTSKYYQSLKGGTKK